MSGQLTRQLRPEEEEILHKREELSLIRATLAERELELVDFRNQLVAFEGRYLRQVGTLYAELDEWKARLSELRAKLHPSQVTSSQAAENRAQARRAYEDAYGEASKTSDFTPTPDLKSLFREVAKRIHPDLAEDSVDLERRTRLMAEANKAYKAGDSEALHRIFNSLQDDQNAIKGEDIGAELIRLIRQISTAKTRLAAIEQELEIMRQSKIAQLKKQAEEKQEAAGEDLLGELAASVREQVNQIKRTFESLAENRGQSS